MHSVAVGRPQSPVVSKFYVEKFKEVAMQSVSLNPVCWRRYVYNTSLSGRHGDEQRMHS